jgi:hypothetical protein
VVAGKARAAGDCNTARDGVQVDDSDLVEGVEWQESELADWVGWGRGVGCNLSTAAKAR